MAALNIQIEVPNMGIYEMEELKHKLTVYAKNLITESKISEKQAISQQESVNENIRYSERLNRLRRLCGRTISTQEIQEDERLAYLLSK